MAHDLRKATVTVNTEADATGALLDGGYLRLYSGTRPAAANAAITTQTLLAELRFGTPAFDAAVDGTITANAITADPLGRGTGDATWFRALRSDGVSAVFDGTVGTSDADFVMGRIDIVEGATIISAADFAYTVPRS